MTLPTPTGSAPDEPSAQTVKPAGLIERLEAAEVGSRELDRDLAKLVDQAEWAKCANWASMPSGAPDDVIDRDALRWLPEYTTSLDAALALAERLNLNGPQALHRTGVNEWMFHFEDMDSHFARTPALAVCAAILRATGSPR